MLTWSLTPHLPAAVSVRTPGSFRSPAVISHTSPAPLTTTMIAPGQDLLLNRAMLSVDKTPYVGRFARDWHRLSTTDHPQPRT